MKTYFGFAIADGMFPPTCSSTREPLTVENAKEIIAAGIESCCNPSHAATIAAMKERFGIEVLVPEKPPQVALESGDAVLVMSVRGLPRLDDKRHEYTVEEIAKATFAFGLWKVQ
jgi:hypothetical protein